MSDEVKNIPERTVERLSLYRRILKYARKDGVKSIYSHEIADRANTSAVIVRRDLMNVGYSGSSRHGYNVEELMDCIHNFFNEAKKVNIAVVGMGHLGLAIRNYIDAEEVQFRFVAGFDIDPKKLFDDKCFELNRMGEIIKERHVDTVVIAVPYLHAQSVANEIYKTHVTSIVNFAPIRLKAPENVYVESIDITTLLEKSLYFGNLFRSKKNL